MGSKEVYLREVVDRIPQLLGLINRSPGSKTYGCFDRQYWHYNTTDFSCAEYQESVLTLAYLYLIDHDTNSYRGKPLILEWINAGIGFWQKIQNRKGSFAEWYPNENSMSVTPFSTYAISETLLLLGDKIKNKRQVIATLEKSGEWLLKNEDLRVSNHYSGSTIALYNLYLLTGNVVYKDGIEKIILALQKLQDEEGWFTEYHGADVGYTSVTLYYLANYYKKSNDKRTLQMISKAMDFVFYFIHPDGSFGGEYGSRHTEYFIPHGFEIMAPSLPKAAAIAESIRMSMERKSHVSPFAFDDRYICYLSYMYIQSYVDAVELDQKEEVLFNREFVKEFPRAGIRIISNSKFYCVQSVRKGCTFKLDTKQGGNSFLDSGIIVEGKTNKTYYSFYFNQDENRLSCGDSLKVSRKLSRIPNHVLTPAGNIFQRVFSMTIGRIEWIEKWVKGILRNILITNIRPSAFDFSREVKITEDRCEVIDSVDKIGDIKRLIIGAKGSYVYGPSTRFFQTSSIYSVPVTYDQYDLEKYLNDGSVRITRQFDEQCNLISLKIEPAPH